MNKEQLLSAVRWLVSGLCGALVTRGVLTEDLVEPIIGAVLSLGTLAWAIWTHAKTETLNAAERVRLRDRLKP
jgi:hypothetical protein